MAKTEPSISNVATEVILENDSPDVNDDNKQTKYSDDELHFENVNTNHDGHDGDEQISLSSSLSISIVTMNDNCVDSSVVDSDSDCDAKLDIEGKYVVHKLGQQSAYAPNSAELQDMNKGLKIICQHITPNGDLRLNNDLSDIVENVHSNGCINPSAASSNIGTIALSNATNVQFGDKHFYEGPVTIQQFLINNREKRKKGPQHVYDNPACETEEISKNAAQANLPATIEVKDVWSYKGLGPKQLALITSGLIIAVITLTSLILYNLTGEKSRFEVEGNFIETKSGKLRIIKRHEWSARPAKSKLDRLELPLHRAIIQHTASPTCQRDIACVFSVQIIQNLHMDARDWADVGYNFLIGGGGQVFVGRDWDYQGAHTLHYNRDSVGIAIIGSFNTTSPSAEQIKALELLLEWGVMEKKLAPDYRLYGALQLSATVSPGAILYNVLKKFPHWSENI